jgi:hypothetical protein
MLLTANGGDGDDVIIGSPGNDILTGGAGDDVLIGNGGTDVLDGGSGNNIVLTAAMALVASGGSASAPTKTTGLQSASNGAHAAGAAALGQFMASSFVTAADTQGGMPLADHQASQPQLLAHPHA